MMPPELRSARAAVLIGGVGYRWQRDASFGVLASDRLAELALPEGVEVMDLGYGAIYAAQDLLRDPPLDRLILLAATERGRPAGRIYASRWEEALPPAEEIQARIFEAGAGVIDLDHLLVIAKHFVALPPEVILIEMEPVDSSGGVELTPEGERCVEEAIGLVLREARVPIASGTSKGVQGW
jgi:hydrogenase maturation protease